MKKQFATRLDENLLEEMKKAVAENKPEIQSMAHFLAIAINDLLRKLAKRETKRN